MAVKSTISKIGKGPFLVNMLFNLITLGIAIMVVNFTHDLANHPECKSIDPVTREGLTGYAWLIGIISALGILGNIYIVVSL